MPLLPHRPMGREPHADADVGNRYRFNDLFTTVWLADALVAALRLDLPDKLDDAPVENPTLYRLLRALAANGIFRELPGQRFEHTELSRQLKADHPYSYRPMALLWGHPTVRRSWEALQESAVNGLSGIRNATGQTLYEHLQAHPDVAERFNGAMISNSAHASESLARAFDLRESRTVADLAGGVGTLLVAVLKHHPNVRGILYELPYLEQSAVLPERAEFRAGDFTREVPSGVDTYLVKNTLWNFPDEVVETILSNVQRAMGERSQLYIAEYLIDDENAPWTAVWDLQMLNLPGGRARTADEYAQLLQKAGLQLSDRLKVEDQTLLRAIPA